MKGPPAPDAPPPADARLPCAECGGSDALDFGHVWLCPDCHAVKAACSCSDLGLEAAGE